MPGTGVFYNSSHVGPAYKDSFKDYSHLELECFLMLAMGAGCSIGDQLHPGGKLSKGSYELIGRVYQSVKEKEPYCRGAKAKTEIAVLNPEEFYPEGAYDLGISPSLIGTVRMLTELSYPFDIIDSAAPMNAYSLLLLPDCIYYNERPEKLLRAYLAQGGKVLGSYDSCLPRDGAESVYGVRYRGEAPFYREFVMPNDVIGKDLPREELVMYLRGYDVEPTGAQVLVNKIEPYFDRAGELFCSHQHAPSSGRVGAPAVTRKGNAVYFSHPIFKLYRKNAPRWCKLMVKDALELLLPNKLVRHNGPSTLQTALQTQEEQGRGILHLLHYITEKRSEDIYTVEDVIPLYDITCSVFVGGRAVHSVTLLPQGRELTFAQSGGYVTFTLAKLEGHCMVGLR